MYCDPIIQGFVCGRRLPGLLISPSVKLPREVLDEIIFIQNIFKKNDAELPEGSPPVLLPQSLESLEAEWVKSQTRHPVLGAYQLVLACCMNSGFACCSDSDEVFQMISASLLLMEESIERENWTYGIQAAIVAAFYILTAWSLNLDFDIDDDFQDDYFDEARDEFEEELMRLGLEFRIGFTALYSFKKLFYPMAKEEQEVLTVISRHFGNIKESVLREMAIKRLGFYPY